MLSDGTFSQLDQPPDDTRPLGHFVAVRERDDVETDPEASKLPQHGIHVKTEVAVSLRNLEYQVDGSIPRASKLLIDNQDGPATFSENLWSVRSGHLGMLAAGVCLNTSNPSQKTLSLCYLITWTWAPH